MPLGLVTTSHSPLMGVNHPADDVQRDVDTAFDEARRFCAEFDPDLVVIFAPDHYNGVFYDLMPPFCIGQRAVTVGDYGTAAGPLDVPTERSRALAQHVLDAGVDVAVSERMRLDHGFAQPLELLFGAVDAVPTIPVFLNAVAIPLGPASRARALGAAIGGFLAEGDERALIVGSGGLSHDPPVPELVGAAPEVAERLIAGRDPGPDVRAERQRRVVQAGRDLAAGTAAIAPLNPEWDNDFLDLLAEGRLDDVDGWTTAWCTEAAGHSSHEVRTWIAAYSALAAAGRYSMRSRFYRPIPEWIAGFGITTAISQGN
ncbi:3-carboxyethylcatechol 2,3-dioxygenase [Tomitella gaofuii]|uniref:3-carboxyethylcatechol 2,3-dioxygenase n=1 Tax=Tomitella gaofuii TaxID=2760083 RepID=UPI0015F85416|nr:3-carboxyethylcatechol 2,3-dioxygenase [Tomitella gaofuii]